MVKDEYAGDESKIPVVEYFGGYKTDKVSVDNVQINATRKETVYEIGSKLPAKQDWLDLLAGTELNWLHAFISTKRIVQGSKHVANPLHDILAPVARSSVSIDKATSKLTAFEKSRES